MNFWLRKKIGVFGSAGGSEMETQKNNAIKIGEEVASLSGILCTGACPGLPHEAALGARDMDGIVLGFSPAMNATEHFINYGFSDRPYILTFTGMGIKGRNLICVRTCDAGIFISGSYGTLSEFTFMYDDGEGKVIGLLAGSGGFVDDIIIPSLKKAKKKSEAIIVIESDPAILVQEIFKQLN